MHPDRDFDRTATDVGAFAADVELPVLLGAAVGDDRFLREVLAAAFAGAWNNDAATIRRRQAVLQDCLAAADGVRQLYAIASEPFGRSRGWEFSLYGHDPGSRLASAVRALRSGLDILRRFRDRFAVLAPGFRSAGLRELDETLRRNLDDAYLEAAAGDLRRLSFRRGVLLSARVGPGGKGVGTVLRKPGPRDLSWLRTALTPGGRSLTYTLHPRDDAGAQAFTELKGRGLGQVSRELFRAAGHVLGFLDALRTELAFFIACLQLHDRLTALGETLCFPEPAGTEAAFTCRNLRDPCLALTLGRATVGTDVSAGGRRLVVITGANRGGKSTFLRSVGLAQLMLQAGLFVAADAFASSLHTGLFTHYRHEEDRTMRSGKFDEELARMSTIADAVRGGGLVLFNESFAATNEREGAEVARQIVGALLENRITVFFVTHMFELSRSFLADDHALFLRADREQDGGRSFRLREAPPLPRSFGRDLFRRVFEVPGR